MTAGTELAAGGKSGGRILWIDVLRGLTVVSMVLYHGMWDAVWLYGLNAPWYRGLPGYLWQQSICWTFILLSGLSLRLGSHPVRRGLEVSALGLLVMAVTNLVMPEERVLFGVLTLIGACMLLTAAGQEKLFSRIPWGIGAPAAAALFFLTRDVNLGHLGFEGRWIAALPGSWYRNLGTAFLGFPPADFFSTDYFSLIPWIFLFLCGYYLHGPAVKYSVRREQTGGLASVPAFLGRHALLIYALHQPLLMLFFQLRSLVSG